MVEPLAGHVELAHGLAVDLHATLADQPAALARREAEGGREQGRQVYRVTGRQRLLWHLVGRLVAADHSREMRLGRARPFLPVPARRHPPGERELPLQRVAGMVALAGEQAPPLR